MECDGEKGNSRFPFWGCESFPDSLSDKPIPPHHQLHDLLRPHAHMKLIQNAANRVYGQSRITGAIIRVSVHIGQMKTCQLIDKEHMDTFRQEYDVRPHPQQNPKPCKPQDIARKNVSRLQQRSLPPRERQRRSPP